MNVLEDAVVRVDVGEAEFRPSFATSVVWATRLAWVGLVYMALTCIVFRNVLQSIDVSLLGPPHENLQDFWNTWYFVTKLHTVSDLFFTNFIKYPEGTPLFYHSFAYPKTFLAALIAPALPATTHALVTLHNVLLLVSFPISAIGAFCLVRHFTKESFSALIGGAIFAFNPGHMTQVQVHMHVASIEFIPFFVLFLIIADQRRSRLCLAASVVFYVLSALSCWYYLFYCMYFLVFYYAYKAVANRAWPGRRDWAVLGAHVAGLIIIAGPLLAPMIVTAASGADVYLSGSDDYVADLLGYVVFPRLHLLGALGAAFRWRLTGNEFEATVYLGLVNLAFVAWLSTRSAAAERRHLPFLIAGTLVFLVIASGNWLHLLGHPLVPMPGYLISDLPFFRNVRAPARAIVFAYLFLAIGVGLAIAAGRRLGNSGRGQALLAVPVLLLAADWYPRPVPVTPYACPPAYALVAADGNPDFAVLDLPLGYRDMNAAMAYQLCHGHPIVSGVVARDFSKTLRDRLITQDLQAQRGQLAENRVKYVVIHRKAPGLFDWNDHEFGPLDAYFAAYKAVYSGPDAILLQVYP